MGHGRGLHLRARATATRRARGHGSGCGCAAGIVSGGRRRRRAAIKRTASFGTNARDTARRAARHGGRRCGRCGPTASTAASGAAKRSGCAPRRGVRCGRGGWVGRRARLGRMRLWPGRDRRRRRKLGPRWDGIGPRLWPAHTLRPCCRRPPACCQTATWRKGLLRLGIETTRPRVGPGHVAGTPHGGGAAPNTGIPTRLVEMRPRLRHVNGLRRIVIGLLGCPECGTAFAALTGIFVIGAD